MRRPTNFGHRWGRSGCRSGTSKRTQGWRSRVRSTGRRVRPQPPAAHRQGRALPTAPRRGRSDPHLGTRGRADVRDDRGPLHAGRALAVPDRPLHRTDERARGRRPAPRDRHGRGPRDRAPRPGPPHRRRGRGVRRRARRSARAVVRDPGRRADASPPARQQAWAARRLRRARGPRPPRPVPGLVAGGRGVRRGGHLSRRGQERGPVQPPARPRGGRQHRREDARGAARARRDLARPAGGDAPGVHPPRGGRGLDLPRLLRRPIRVPGGVHRREVPLVAAARRRDELRPDGRQPGPGGAVTRPVPAPRLPRDRRPGLAVRPPRPAVQAPRLQPAGRRAVPSVRDDRRHRRGPRHAPRPHGSHDPRGPAGARTRLRGRDPRRAGACRVPPARRGRGGARTAPARAGRAGVVPARRPVAAARRVAARWPRRWPCASASSAGRGWSGFRRQRGSAGPTHPHRSAGRRTATRGRTAAAVRTSPPR